MIYANNRKAPGATNTKGLTTDTNKLNSATGERHSKAIATQIAELALAGHVVHKGQSGDYLACKHGMNQYCQDLEALQSFARKLGVSK